MKKAILFLIILSGLIPYPAFSEEYSLSDLYRLALERSERIKIAEEDLYISQREEDRAMAVLIPTLSTFGSYTKYSEEKMGTFSVIQPDHSTSWGLRLDQSLSLSGKEITALKIARESIVKSGFDLDSVKEEYLMRVAFDYINLLKARKALEIARANVERLTKYRDAAQTRLRVGEITKTVLLRAEAELSGAHSELIRAENALKLFKTILGRTVGIKGDYDVRESEEEVHGLPLSACPTPSGGGEMEVIGCLKQTAFIERKELKSAELERQVAQDQVKFTRGSYWPTLSVEGVYARYEDHPSSEFTNEESIYGIVRLDYPFFEGGLRRAEVRQSEARFRQTDYRYNDLKDNIAVEVENTYLAMITASSVRDQLQSETEYARENFNAVTKQFQYGLSDSIDVMDANTLLVTSERELANAQYNYELAILGLRRATGTLLKTVLGQLP